MRDILRLWLICYIVKMLIIILENEAGSFSWVGLVDFVTK